MKDHFAELAEQIVADIPEALGCVVTSFDGEPLAAHPAQVLNLLKPHSAKLARLSGIQRAFLEFGGSSLLSLTRSTYAVVIVTAQSVDHEQVFADLEAVVDRAKGAEVTPGAALPSMPELPELVTADAATAPSQASTSKSADLEPSNTVGLAQEFSSLLAESFGAGEADSETSEAEAAS